MVLSEAVFPYYYFFFFFKNKKKNIKKKKNPEIKTKNQKKKTKATHPSFITQKSLKQTNVVAIYFFSPPLFLSDLTNKQQQQQQTTSPEPDNCFITDRVTCFFFFFFTEILTTYYVRGHICCFFCLFIFVGRSSLLRFISHSEILFTEKVLSSSRQSLCFMFNKVLDIFCFFLVYLILLTRWWCFRFCNFNHLIFSFSYTKKKK